ncbi:hypothetical protein [Turicibacter sp. 1E2]
MPTLINCLSQCSLVTKRNRYQWISIIIMSLFIKKD